MGGNTQMYYLNGRIDYNEIVTRPGRPSPPPPLSRPWGENHSEDGVCIPDGLRMGMESVYS